MVVPERADGPRVSRIASVGLAPCLIAGLHGARSLTFAAEAVTGVSAQSNPCSATLRGRSAYLSASPSVAVTDSPPQQDPSFAMSASSLLVLAAAGGTCISRRRKSCHESRQLCRQAVGTLADSTSSTMCSPEEVLQWERLKEWLTARGGNVEKVKMDRPNGMRGLVATTDIAEGEAIIEVPISASVELQHKSDSADPSIPALEFLRVVREKTDQGGRDVTPYLDLVPDVDSDDMTSMPDFFSAEVLDMLQCPPAVEKTKRRQNLCATRATENSVDARQMQWAMCTVAQRSFTVSSPFDGLLRLMLPGIDMFNHSAEATHGMKVTWQLEGMSDGIFKVVAGAPIKAGDEIFICYGGNPYRDEGCGGDCKGDIAWTNDQYMMRYGFPDQSIGTMMVDGKWLASEECASIREALAQTALEEDEAQLNADGLSTAVRAAVGFRVALKRALRAQQEADKAAAITAARDDAAQNL